MTPEKWEWDRPDWMQGFPIYVQRALTQKWMVYAGELDVMETLRQALHETQSHNSRYYGNGYSQHYIVTEIRNALNNRDVFGAIAKLHIYWRNYHDNHANIRQ